MKIKVLDDVDNSFLGKGFPFPYEFQVKNDYEKAIKQAIYCIVMTKQGERVMRPDFGSRIWEYVFELNSPTILYMMCNEIEQCIERWEHRVMNVKAKIDTSEFDHSNKLIIDVTYTIRDTNRADNLVFPFYIHEGQW